MGPTERKVLTCEQISPEDPQEKNLVMEEDRGILRDRLVRDQIWIATATAIRLRLILLHKTALQTDRPFSLITCRPVLKTKVERSTDSFTMGSKLVASFLVFSVLATVAYAQLSETFYESSCPGGPAKVAEVVTSSIVRDRTLAASLLRLHFHDCFVRGCDASVLLDGPNGEKEAFGNKNSLRGFEVIDDIKRQVEALCPGVVSCADIVALAARDAVVAIRGTNWSVPLGRRDGVVGSAAEANNDLPPPFADFSMLSAMFSRKGLNTRDLVVLSGSHTIGFVSCATMQTRLYNFSSTSATDPTLDPNFANTLKRQCRVGDTTTKIKMDQTKFVDTWDFNFYSNVLRGKALLQSDDALKRNSNSLKIVQQMNRAGSPFNAEFGRAMIKMGQVDVLTGSSGEIRRRCNAIN
ncbi:peroxidase [Marchantia polymorpha subsp. ruderalis]|uniref:Peroxidase n=2 Tax=Marchantia polymorpha TaxID=3197 RepID=A0AAF6BID0_MARPO|nr:hypothetical protein MARPO_0032s0145 [Marchantia polymorpha]BBN11764.1 hypothetical protein Mp_5g14530 [Marchantia polymorpha subsp. ruderalis]|eukprot:PTQ41982.1 hypothetical protein MARPO_0032s0145 [Marchantia polymorpha]